MTNGEKFKQTFGFDVDESKVIAVNPKWWDCEFQNNKPITKRISPADMQADELVETIRKQCYYMDCGNCNTCVKLKAADIIETLYDAYTENFSVIEDVRPVVHGHWIDGTCSNCGFFTDIVMSRFFSYCPNCGAMMEES